MSAKHLLYFTSGLVTLYRWRAGRLSTEASFPNSEEGAAAFAVRLGVLPPGLFFVLVDVVEEDFHQENVPFVRGRDRDVLLKRKLAQRYRDTSLATTISLGTERTERKDERVLFTSFTNTQQFQPWLDALRESELALAGVYSAALLAPGLARQLGRGKGSTLVVTLEQAGLRQTFVENGKVRFSRLGPLDVTEFQEPGRIAEAFDRETTRVYQYLAAMRVIGRDAPVLDALLIAPDGERERIEAGSPNLPQLRIEVIEVRDVCKKIGLKEYPENAGGEVILLHALAQHPPGEQYAGQELRGAYRQWQTKLGLIAGGAVVGGACVLFAGWQLVQTYNFHEAAAAERTLASQANQRYSGITAKFPPMPTSTENLRVTVQQHQQLLASTSPPERLLADVSKAIEASPKIEVEKINWETSTGLRKGKTPPGQPGAAATAPQANDTARYEIVEIGGRVLSARANDYRAITETVNQFAETLGRQKGIEIISRTLPFDTGSERSLSGDVGADRAGEQPRFTVTAARKLGA